jgi:hypothetical protein
MEEPTFGRLRLTNDHGLYYIVSDEDEAHHHIEAIECVLAKAGLETDTGVMLLMYDELLKVREWHHQLQTQGMLRSSQHSRLST